MKNCLFITNTTYQNIFINFTLSYQLLLISLIQEHFEAQTKGQEKPTKTKNIHPFFPKFLILEESV